MTAFFVASRSLLLLSRSANAVTSSGNRAGVRGIAPGPVVVVVVDNAVVDNDVSC